LAPLGEIVLDAARIEVPQRLISRKKVGDFSSKPPLIVV
jgi:hypothetical protein